jgi:tetratricopeptide (TPR) repeat protein
MTARSCEALGAAALICASLACHSADPGPPIIPVSAHVVQPPAGMGLQPVGLPDYSLMDEPVAEQMRARQTALTNITERSSIDRDGLAAAYGDMGKLLMAATYLDAAESCYRNASTLAPRDARWAYYLGHLYKSKGPIARSVASFERALELRPDDVATLVWLGEGYLAQGRFGDAESTFAKASSRDSKSAAALAGSGRTALARKDFARAVRMLEQALEIEPRASGLHYSLAMAYRGLGDASRAQAHLSLKGDIEPRPPDPLMWELDDLLESAQAYNARGARALAAGDGKAAAGFFRRAVELAPENLSLREQLGTALFRIGDRRAAAEQFELILRQSPQDARALFNLGVLDESGGRTEEATDRFRAALKQEPGHAQARVRLAAVLQRSGKTKEALDHYEKALEADPSSLDAAFGYAMTLVRLQRYAEARDRLSDGMNAHPAQTSFSHALARLLAAAPDDKVRDGKQAQMLVGQLLKQQPSIELGETMAMTLAELGQFEQAASLQREILATAEKAGRRDAVPRLTENLRLYERRKACRRPFADSEL